MFISIYLFIYFLGNEFKPNSDYGASYIACPHEAKNSTFVMVLITSFSINVFIYLFICIYFNYCDLKFTSSVRYSLKMFGSKLLLLLLFFMFHQFFIQSICVLKKLK